MVAAGKLREYITIQQPTETESVSGAISQGWSTFWATRAAVVQGGGGEDFDGDAASGRARYEVMTRYYTGVKPKMRAIWGDVTLEIVEVRADPLRTSLMLSCVETLDRE